MRNLINWLNERTREYDAGCPTVTDKEWDNKYFTLKQMEKQMGIFYPDSPTQSIQYQAVNGLKKVAHNHDMLSLDKTKDIQEVISFLGDKPYIAMLKMDGLTCSLLYSDGKLVSAETRGNGQVGEDVSHNAAVISNIPKQIPYTGKLIVDGEIICRKDNFEEFAEEYKNPRNFASGSIRLFDSQECAKRKLSFVVWEVIEGLEDIDDLANKLDMVESFGFTIVPYITSLSNVSFDVIEKCLVSDAKGLSYPIDGLVFKFNDCRFGKVLGQTGHHAKNALAYKFYDESYETTLLDIEWQVGRTGQITPIARFEPIDTGDSIVERASLHNLTITKNLLGNPYVGQPIKVVKSNMIIPQVIEAVKVPDNADAFYNFLSIPEMCPICGEPTIIKNDTDSEFLICSSPECEGKFINRVEHFACKKGLDIKGISKATLEKLMNWGWLNTISDIFKLQEHRDEWIRKPGFGAKSVDNILNAIESSRQCDLNKFIAALGIPLIGTSASKDLAKHFGTWESFIEAVDNDYHFYNLPNFGIEMHKAILNFDYSEAIEIASNYLTFNTTSSASGTSSLEGMTFVVTGKIAHFKNRDELKAKIESMGGKVTGSVSNKTNYLINNDSTSSSSKNLKAKELGIPILTEDKFIETFGIVV